MAWLLAPWLLTCLAGDLDRDLDLMREADQ
jgi:hypothetical protein